ncbi:response regulator [Clostridium chromiireducens]|uniref:Stage 0 sporulation protein A homolog n=1 Tax=Clostridium chromiireducens TaxID=225345 RepID=A0A1V4IRP5_9CLOT|nr:response regulator [Clostridium chromiireducens]MVX65437.1 response regulator [Clostridium chromiireducens]OPJ62490.1 transcriptional regulatory protein CusR [Clostridium chromiireducens]
MKILIVEDDEVSRLFLQKSLSQYGECDITIDGMEALDAYLIGLQEGMPYDLICLDIMIPKVNGVKVLKSIRELERKKRMKKNQYVKVIVITALAETQFVNESLTEGYDVYIEKPINSKVLDQALNKLGLI